MNFEIRSVNTKYNDGELTGVTVSYTARNEARSVSVNGNLELSAEAYKDNESISKLEELAKEHLLSEISAE